MNLLAARAAQSRTAPRHFAPANGWPLLARLIGEEVLAAANDEQRDGFFGAVGKRVAALAAMEGLDDLDAIVGAMNDVWAMLGFGHVSIELDDDGIDIIHADVPRGPDDHDQRWAQASIALLEGAYDAWFRALGSKSTLRTWVRRQQDGTVELRHGL